MVQRTVLFVIGGTLLDMEVVCNFIDDAAAIFIAAAIEIFQHIPLIQIGRASCRERVLCSV